MRRTVPLKIGGVRWRVDETNQEDVRRWLDTYFHGVLGGDLGVSLKAKGATRVSAHAGLVLKQRTYRSGDVRRWIRAVVCTPARRIAGLSVCMRHAGLPVPEALGWGMRLLPGTVCEDYLLTREIQGVRRLTEILIHEQPTADERYAILDACGRMAAGLHVSGFMNRDMKDGNILIDCTGKVRCWMVDLDGAGRLPALFKPAVIRRDFWPLFRSFGYHGWAGAEDIAVLLAAYNTGLPRACRLRAVPKDYRRRLDRLLRERADVYPRFCG